MQKMPGAESTTSVTVRTRPVRWGELRELTSVSHQARDCQRLGSRRPCMHAPMMNGSERAVYSAQKIRAAAAGRTRTCIKSGDC